MGATITIEIDDYLSEREKASYAIEAFKEAIKESLFKGKTGVLADSEAQRILGNISYSIVERMVSEYLPDYTEVIKEKVQRNIEKGDLSYLIFKTADAWGGQNSLAIQTINETVNKNKDLIRANVEKAISEFDYTSDVREKIAEQMNEISEVFYKLNELFSK